MSKPFLLASKCSPEHLIFVLGAMLWSRQRSISFVSTTRQALLRPRDYLPRTVRRVSVLRLCSHLAGTARILTRLTTNRIWPILISSLMEIALRIILSDWSRCSMRLPSSLTTGMLAGILDELNLSSSRKEMQQVMDCMAIS